MLCIWENRPACDFPIIESEVDFDETLKNSAAGLDEMKSAVQELRREGYLIQSNREEIVYLIKSEWSGFCKIGYTKAPSVEHRLERMRTGDPSLKLIAKIKAGKAFELHLHRSHSDCRVDREWFNLTDTQIELVKAAMLALDRKIEDALS